ncbi:MAG: outer membrane protein assembly factor BamA [Candidatus Fischerbacteria bacterium RBG_13_37_8]|uniref:Outer membrane protein assembly factor BamA n=1 Tax=Candidatus Fischerbacteria bacterium RBG_13_37_8 TaxID=1817863 RepID=A0A1F5VFP3_9BACT|nr:MAG: outer membrane protein assembly factor BamA [Candidatus Fischerbacteria bacterium RBG_13_37_8]
MNIQKIFNNKTSVFLLLLIMIAWTACLAQQDEQTAKIQQIKIEGQKHIALQTYQYYMQCKEGDLYDETRLKADLMKLWKTDLFLDVKMEVEDGTDGKIVIIKVKEKPKIKEISYQGQKKLNISDITKKIEEKKLDLKPDNFYDPFVAKKTENVIRELLEEKGYRLASVTMSVEYLKENYVKVIYKIDEGESLRIGKIEFSANKAYPDKKLRKSMKKLKQHNFLSWITKKDKLDTEKLDEDVENVKEFYYNHGYINIKIGEPKITSYDTKTFFRRKEIKRLIISFPVEEGNQFKFGQITITGNKVLEEKKLIKLATFKEGDIFSRSKIRDFIQDAQELYGEYGYLFASLQPSLDIKETEKIANIEFQVLEDYPQYVRKIEFIDNTYTYDKVLRREMKIQEGDLVKISLLRKSFDRLYRTGFFDNIEPDVQKVENEQSKIDLKVKVQENKRNEIRFGGGYSQLEKFFGTIAFSTRNLFGTGKIFDIYIQNGSRTSMYKAGVTDPYFLGYDYTLGIDLARSRLEYYIFDRQSTGGTILFGFPVYEEVRSLFAYGYEVTNVSNIITEQTADPDLIAFYQLLYGTGTRRTQSRFIPQIYRSTLNNPMDPTDGSNISLAVSFAGGILGGNVNLVKPIFKITQFHPIGRRPTVFAYNFETGYAKGFGGLEVPVYENFFLGGEYSIRGYDIRTIGPIDPNISKVYTIGGDKYLQFNMEYQIPIAGPVKLAAFLDGGNAFAKGERIDFTDLRYSAGAEIRIMAPFFNAPIRFIYAINFNRGPIVVDRTTFRFAIGRTF